MMGECDKAEHSVTKHTIQTTNVVITTRKQEEYQHTRRPESFSSTMTIDEVDDFNRGRSAYHAIERRQRTMYM